MVLSFALSGQGARSPAFGLDDVRELALSHGFERKGAPPDAPAAQRADLDAFFAAFDCKALSTFRKRFAAEALAPPRPGAAAAPKPVALPTGFKARTRRAARRVSSCRGAAPRASAWCLSFPAALGTFLGAIFRHAG